MSLHKKKMFLHNPEGFCMFIKTALPEFLSVNSIISLFRVDMKTKGNMGEAHDFYEFLYVRRGTHRGEVDGKVYTLSEGQLLLYAPMSYHSLKEKSSAEGDIISFDSASSYLSLLVNKVITLSSKQKNMLSAIMEVGETCFEGFSRGNGSFGMKLRQDVDMYELHNLKNQLELFLIDLYSQEKKATGKTTAANYDNYKSEIFETAVHFMQSNIDRRITIEAICENCLVSPYLLKEVFRAKQNMPPIEYFIHLKIEKAKSMIKNSSMNFTQIAEVLGFSTVHYFSRIFKNKVGVSPKEYAKKAVK